jgi:hypothetical protein
MKFNLIILSKLNDEYYNMEALDKNGNVVYKSTLPNIEACKVIMKYKNVKII